MATQTPVIETPLETNNFMPVLKSTTSAAIISALAIGFCFSTLTAIILLYSRYKPNSTMKDTFTQNGQTPKSKSPKYTMSPNFNSINDVEDTPSDIPSVDSKLQKAWKIEWENMGSDTTRVGTNDANKQYIMQLMQHQLMQSMESTNLNNGEIIPDLYNIHPISGIERTDNDQLLPNIPPPVFYENETTKPFISDPNAVILSMNELSETTDSSNAVSFHCSSESSDDSDESILNPKNTMSLLANAMNTIDVPVVEASQCIDDISEGTSYQ